MGKMAQFWKCLLRKEFTGGEEPSGDWPTTSGRDMDVSCLMVLSGMPSAHSPHWPTPSLYGST